jgi:hypothetical protein
MKVTRLQIIYLEKCVFQIGEYLSTGMRICLHFIDPSWGKFNDVVHIYTQLKYKYTVGFYSYLQTFFISYKTVMSVITFINIYNNFQLN